MYKITKKPLTSNVVWDSENNRPLCKFSKGVIETNDTGVAEKLASLGHTVEGAADAEEGQQTPDPEQSNAAPDPETPVQGTGEASDTEPEQTPPAVQPEQTEQQTTGEPVKVEGAADATPKKTNSRRSRKG